MNKVNELQKASSLAETLSLKADSLRTEWKRTAIELKQAEERHSKALSAYSSILSESTLAVLRAAHLEALAKADACLTQREQYLREAEKHAKALATLLGQPDKLEDAA